MLRAEVQMDLDLNLSLTRKGKEKSPGKHSMRSTGPAQGGVPEMVQQVLGAQEVVAQKRPQPVWANGRGFVRYIVYPRRYTT